MGMSMRVERSTIDQVKERLRMHKKKDDEQERVHEYGAPREHVAVHVVGADVTAWYCDRLRSPTGGAEAGGDPQTKGQEGSTKGASR